MPTADLDDNERRVLDHYAAAVRPPTLRDAAAALGVSHSTVQGVIDRLVAKGRLVKCPGARGLELPDDRRPGLGCDLEIAGVVAAGRPVGPPDGPLGRFDFSDAFGGDDKMMLRVRGRSMVDAGILDGDYIVVRQADDAESGAKVVVRVDGAFTLKIYRKRQGKVWLDACNKEVPPMPLTALDEPRIVGVYVGLVRQG